VSAAPFNFARKILGSGAVVLALFLLVGYLLPGRWEADASVRVPAEAQAVFRFLDSPEGWRAWTPWPDSGLVRSGPDRGEGATLSWNDPNLGSGSFRIVRVTAPERVDYAVDVGEGAMRTEGTVALAPEDGGVRVTWHEEGDLGKSPLMGYWALRMGRAQGAELSKGLDRLSALAVGGAAPGTPADSTAVGTSESR
jgi:uncharacterized protein YndB with AHSA1/START domain